MDWKRAKPRCLTSVSMPVLLALAACTNGGGHSQSPAPSPVALTVHVGLFGGPARPDGGMAMSNSPAERVNVTATSAAGRTSTAMTDASGRATLHLAPGRYAVFSTYCGPGPQTISLSAGEPAQLQIICPIP
jgi:hypothetical protein